MASENSILLLSHLSRLHLQLYCWQPEISLLLAPASLTENKVVNLIIYRWNDLHHKVWSNWWKNDQPSASEPKLRGKKKQNNLRATATNHLSSIFKLTHRCLNEQKCIFFSHRKTKSRTKFQETWRRFLPFARAQHFQCFTLQPQTALLWIACGRAHDSSNGGIESIRAANICDINKIKSTEVKDSDQTVLKRTALFSQTAVVP